MARLRARIARAAAVVAIVASVVAITACRTAPSPAVIVGPGADAPWPEQRAALGKLDRYNLAGRVAVVANGQGFTASLRYEQQPTLSNLALDGPLGIGGLRAVLEGEQLSIATSRGEKLDGVAARDELERRLGFPLPLAEMRWWLLGIPAPGAEHTERQDITTHELTRFVQNGWSVTIEKRMPSLGFALPQRLTAEREGARMKLVVERWLP